jgi:hypothetical protein
MDSRRCSTTMWSGREPRCIGPPAFRISSLTLHILDTWLLYAIGLAWTRMRSAAAWAAVFFAVYEGHQEAIMWFSANNELLLFLFGGGSRREPPAVHFGAAFQGIGFHPAAAVFADYAGGELAAQPRATAALLRSGGRDDGVGGPDPRPFLPLQGREFFPARARVAYPAEKLRKSALFAWPAQGCPFCLALRWFTVGQVSSLPIDPQPPPSSCS